jgi:GDP-L-fucose synthase
VRTLLTGANGFIGTRVATLLAVRGVDVLAPSRSELDLTNPLHVRRFLDTHRPNVLVHLAAVTGSGPAMRRDPVHYLHANLDVGRVLSENASRFERIVTAGSAGEYPTPYVPRQTGFLPDELWDGTPCAGGYGLARRTVAWAFEQGARGTFTVVVFPTVYGPGDGGRGAVDADQVRAIPAFAARILAARDEVIHFGTGREERDLLHVDDAAASIVAAIDRVGKPLRAHVTDGIPRRMSTIAEDLSRELAFTGRHRWVDRPDAPTDRLWLAPAGLDALGFAPRIPWEVGLEDVAADVRQRGVVG